MPPRSQGRRGKGQKAREDAGKRAVFAGGQKKGELGTIFEFLGVFEGRNEREAKSAAIESVDGLRKAIDAGELELAAPPAAGFKPKAPLRPKTPSYGNL